MAFHDAIGLKIAQKMNCFRVVKTIEIAGKVAGYTIVFLPELKIPNMSNTKLTELVIAAIAAVTEKAIVGASHE